MRSSEGKLETASNDTSAVAETGSESVEGEMKSYLFPTFDGKKIDIFNFGPDDVSLNCIPRSLSMQCRFNGHLNRFYSVAEHAVRMSYLVPDRVASLALHHDDHETWTGDIVRTIVRNFTDAGVFVIDDAKKELDKHIFRMWGISDLVKTPEAGAVWELDACMPIVEAVYAGLHPFPQHFDLTTGLNGSETLAKWAFDKSHAFNANWGWDQKEAERAYICRAKELR